METLITNDISQMAKKGPCIDFLFAYTDHDIEKMLSFCDPNGSVYFKPLGEDGKGTIGELGKGLWSSLLDAFPDIATTVHASVADGAAIRCQVLIKGTQAKDFAGIECKGNGFNSDHIFVFRLNEDNRINKIEIEWDHADFARQLQA
ncbi:MAG: ester cyclase [Bacteroidota bacterium]